MSLQFVKKDLYNDVEKTPGLTEHEVRTKRKARTAMLSSERYLRCRMLPLNNSHGMH
jgi:hypothetical protein